MGLELEKLINKLNPETKSAIQKAAELCVSQSHYNVEVEHLIHEVLDKEDNNFCILLKYFGIDVDLVKQGFQKTVDSFSRGNSRTPSMSPHVVTLLQEAWLFTSIKTDKNLIGTDALLMSLLTNKILRGLILEAAPSVLKIPIKVLEENIFQIISGSHETSVSGADTQNEEFQKQPALDQFTRDITEEARTGKLDPVVERDREIRQIIDILTRRRQNNPILTGDAGVGKTAVVEGFAQKVVLGEVPEALKGVSVRALDLGLLQAGAGVKGEFEKRLKDVITEVESAAKPIVLFIDEAHTLIGAGGQEGQNDAANLLKPALARGELRTIAATTWAEYKRYFEKDAALVRRFQVIKVAEPEIPAAIRMIRSTAQKLEEHHKLRIMDEAIVAAVKLSHKYLTGRKLPDKALSLLDTACARVSIGKQELPESMGLIESNIEGLDAELSNLKRERHLDVVHTERITELEKEISEESSFLTEKKKRWQQEKDLVAEIYGIEKTLEAGESLCLEDQKLLKQKRTEFRKMTETETLVHLNVDQEIISTVISNWTGVPAGKMMTDEIEQILRIQDFMGERLIGQDHALEMIAKRVRTSRAKLDDPDKPIGVFMLVGPSGVGKTETALTLADLLYGGEDKVITLNMSEYQEAHSVSALKGAPPGYVGYGKGGVLTEAVRRQPFSVILLDEVEKAHPDVMEVFYQVFDKGMIEDGEGVRVDFKNTVILLTSNLGSSIISDNCSGDKEPLPSSGALANLIRPALLQSFKPAFLGRLIVVPYYPLGEAQIKQIITLKINKIIHRFEEQNRAKLVVTPTILDQIAKRCTEVDSGARNVDSILTNSLLPELSAELLIKWADQEKINSVIIDINKDGFFEYKFS
ncbi:MAG: type VI secretion system ATPase TssH [Proteobacteria bacterium]|nr:type VI secretion system ATPase TssH [Pseudomonadota bacterium]